MNRARCDVNVELAKREAVQDNVTIRTLFASLHDAEKVAIGILTDPERKTEPRCVCVCVCVWVCVWGVGVGGESMHVLEALLLQPPSVFAPFPGSVLALYASVA